MTTTMTATTKQREYSKGYKPQTRDLSGIRPLWLDINQIGKLTGFKKGFLLKLIEANAFPQPIKLGYRCNRWSLAEVEHWIIQQEKSRQPTA